MRLEDVRRVAVLNRIGQVLERCMGGCGSGKGWDREVYCFDRRFGGFKEQVLGMVRNGEVFEYYSFKEFWNDFSKKLGGKSGKKQVK